MGYVLDILECGEILAQESILFHDGKETSFRKIGCFAWLLRQGEDNILVDTGINNLTIANQIRKGPNPWLQKKKQRIEHQLAVKGLCPADITQVILTHLHYDHCSNVPLFPKARLVLSREEWNRIMNATGSEAENIQLALQEIIIYLQKVGHERVKLLDRNGEISPDLKVSWVGGHTSGSQWVEVNCQLGRCLLAGDAVFLIDNINQSRPIGFTEDLQQSKHILSWLKEFPGTVLPSHDLTILQHFRKGVPGHV